MTQVRIINAFLNSGNDGVSKVLFLGAFTLQSEKLLPPFGKECILNCDENITFLPPGLYVLLLSISTWAIQCRAETGYESWLYSKRLTMPPSKEITTNHCPPPS